MRSCTRLLRRRLLIVHFAPLAPPSVHALYTWQARREVVSMLRRDGGVAGKVFNPGH